MMKWIGAILIIAACVGFGLMISGFHRKEVAGLKKLISALNFMECELQYRMPALPELLRRTATECDGNLKKVFHNLAAELDEQVSPDVKHCMNFVLDRAKDIPNETKVCLLMLGESLGQFDLQGQIKSLENVRRECKERLSNLLGNADVRLRSYQTLGVCAGAALIILLM